MTKTQLAFLVMLNLLLLAGPVLCRYADYLEKSQPVQRALDRMISFKDSLESFKL